MAGWLVANRSVRTLRRHCGRKPLASAEFRFLSGGAGCRRIDRNDTSWYIPLGLSAEYPINPKLALASILIVDLHDINLQPSLEKDHTSVSLLFGIRFGP